MIKKLDGQERLIVRELIRNPRVSDNQIARRTGVPVMTVNRKRKRLEKEGLLRYYTHLETGPQGTGTFTARQLHIIKFKEGVTPKFFLERSQEKGGARSVHTKYINESELAEVDGHLAVICEIEGATEQEIVEIFNGRIIPDLKQKFGEDSILEIKTIRLNVPFRILHNYLLLQNMENGIIRKDWKDDWIFVDE